MRTTASADVKKLFNRLRRSTPKGRLLESDNPLDHLIFAVLSEDNSPARAKTALNRLLGYTVDYNDLRVSTAQELAYLLERDLSNAQRRTSTLIRILNAIYESENTVTLDHVKTKNKKEAREYLQGLDGMSPYVLASTMLWAFGEHTIPVDGQILYVLKKEELVPADATMEQAEGILKRHIRAADAQAFAAVLKRYAAQRAPRSSPVSSKRKKSGRRTAVRRS